MGHRGRDLRKVAGEDADKDVHRKPRKFVCALEVQGMRPPNSFVNEWKEKYIQDDCSRSDIDDAISRYNIVVTRDCREDKDSHSPNVSRDGSGANMQDSLDDDAEEAMLKAWMELWRPERVAESG